MLQEDIQKNILRVFEKHEKDILFSYLFGSMARREQIISSDIDIAVFFAEGTPEAYFDVMLSVHADLCRALKRNDVDIVILNTATNLVLLDEIARSGVVLFDRDPEARTDFEIRTLHSSLDFKSLRLAVMGA